jgi:hypothetical protein
MMSLNVTSIVLFVTGVVLLYAGIKNVDPRDVVKKALKGESPAPTPDKADTKQAASEPRDESTPKPPYLSV